MPPPSLFPRVDKRNVGFHGVTSRGRLRWVWAFTQRAGGGDNSACVCWAATLFMFTGVTSVLEFALRNALAAWASQRRVATHEFELMGDGDDDVGVASRVCSLAMLCRGEIWPFAFEVWVAVCAVVYSFVRFTMSLDLITNVGTPPPLNTTRAPPFSVKLCWALHVLAVTPTFVQLAVRASVSTYTSEYDDEDRGVVLIVAVCLWLRAGVLLVDLLASAVPVFVEHVVWIWLECFVFFAFDVVRRQHATGHASACYYYYELDAFLVACVLTLVVQYVGYVLTVRVRARPPSPPPLGDDDHVFQRETPKNDEDEEKEDLTAACNDTPQC